MTNPGAMAERPRAQAFSRTATYWSGGPLAQITFASSQPDSWAIRARWSGEIRRRSNQSPTRPPYRIRRVIRPAGRPRATFLRMYGRCSGVVPGIRVCPTIRPRRDVISRASRRNARILGTFPARPRLFPIMRIVSKVPRPFGRRETLAWYTSRTPPTPGGARPAALLHRVVLEGGPLVRGGEVEGEVRVVPSAVVPLDDRDGPLPEPAGEHRLGAQLQPSPPPG